APEAAPNAAPARGIKKIRPISVPQMAPPTAPAAVVLIIWFNLILPLASFTATTASPSSSRYSFCMASNFCRTSSAFASLGNAITTRSLIVILLYHPYVARGAWYRGAPYAAAAVGGAALGAAAVGAAAANAYPYCGRDQFRHQIVANYI